MVEHDAPASRMNEAHRCDGGRDQSVTKGMQPSIISARTHSSIQFEVLLDNLRSVYNVGAIFRTSDGAGVRKVHLCGTTPTPDHVRLSKTALGTEQTIPWTYHTNSLIKAQKLGASGRLLWALERTNSSSSVFAAGKPVAPTESIVIVVGNEVAGVDPEILALCDEVLHIPMSGTKESLNVAVAFGIAIYMLRFGVQISTKS